MMIDQNFSQQISAPNTNYEQLSQSIQNFMKENDIPAGQLCVMQDSNIAYQNNYGNINCEGLLSDRADRKVIKDDLFRIASTSKPVTGMGILLLAQKGLLNLDQSAFNILAQAGMIDPSTIKDKRILNITVRQLLRHEGGWDTSIGVPQENVKDPQYDALRIANPNPPMVANSLDLIKYMITKPLNFVPGTKAVFSTSAPDRMAL